MPLPPGGGAGPGGGAAPGASVQEVRFPDATQAVEDWPALCAVETAVAHGATFPARREAYGPGLAGLIDLGLGLSATDYQRLLLRRADFTGRVRALFAQVDLLLVPATAFAAPRCNAWRISAPMPSCSRHAALHLPVRPHGQPHDHAARRTHF